MPLRSLLRYLLNNEQIVQKISESYPIRRAAQLTTFLFHKGQEIGHESLEKLKDADLLKKMQDDTLKAGKEWTEGAKGAQNKLNSFRETFKKEYEAGMKEIEEKQKKK
ncbi:hypothetical protein LOTGIDRAFT_232464 [Lottia gigantea]|uniref:Uncharacterized protein n=1 Tax=Lottia gigantea TaxID=225164 RepID=V4AGB6_LOTGI|nr:hypothetical protein LOTGIDRAFT_232464 [Lottia gigantea]ESO94210.1 hypothetical protein LOTGIDRAFT_232464 [Lottia gigantea]